MSNIVFAIEPLLAATISQRAAEQARVEVLEAGVSQERLLRILRADSVIALPQLRAYDRSGRLIRDFGDGVDKASFAGAVAAVLERPAADPAAASTFAAERDGILDKAGAPVVLEGEADLTFVQYWAEWCIPCHEQFDLLRATLRAQQRLAVRVLHVDLGPAIPAH